MSDQLKKMKKKKENLKRRKLKNKAFWKKNKQQKKY
jgi:hypothetical protein